MPSSTPKYRRPLKPDQVEVLQLLYRFRFTTTQLIATYQHKKNAAAVFNRMRVLEEQGYIGRNFEPSYRLLGKPASYYLLPKGIQVLRQDSDNASAPLHGMYKDKNASNQFIERSLTLFQAYTQLSVVYADYFDLFTKPELAEFTYFPKKLPDAYISLKGLNKARTKHYLLLVFDEATLYFAHVNRIKDLIKHTDTGAWDEPMGKPPIVLVICDTLKQQKSLQPRIAKTVQAADVKNPQFYITHKDTIAKLSADNADIWQSVTDPVTLRSLRTM